MLLRDEPLQFCAKKLYTERDFDRQHDAYSLLSVPVDAIVDIDENKHQKFVDR